MTLVEISDKIKAIMDGYPNGVFLRATDPQANVDLDYVDLNGKIIALFNNLPDSDHIVSQTGYITESLPIEVKVLELANLDDREQESDIIRDRCKAVADKIFDAFNNSVDSFLPQPGYRVNRLGETKLYDKTMTGVRLSFIFQTSRGNYAC